MKILAIGDEKMNKRFVADVGWIVGLVFGYGLVFFLR